LQKTPRSLTPELLTPGLFISFEGVEGCGKTTQVKLLAAGLREAGYSVYTTIEPGGTKLGERITDIVLSSTDAKLSPAAELFLFLADRAQHVAEALRPALVKNQIIISDRYLDATVAYQGYGRGFDPGLIELMNRLAVAGVSDVVLLPQITILLDLDPRLGLERAKKRRGLSPADRIEQQDVSFHARVRQGYLELAALYPERIRRVPAAYSPRIVSRMIWELIKDCLPDLN